MTTSSLVLVLALVAGGLAAPWGAETPRCSTECPVTGSPKLAYEPGKTYTYAYSGKSKVQLKGVQDGDSDIEWAAGIDLTWITPCDVAISFTNIKMDGAPGPDAARTLQRFPMVVAVADGRVQHVCAHPEDQPWAINLKKGVASALQNSIPSLSPVASGITVTETDVVGKCPTKYEVETEGEKLIVTKEKDHRHCNERFPTPFEVPAPWMKAPLPLEESRSECKQVIENGIYTEITCEDKNIVRPAFGLYKYVEANQESTLRFVSESSDTSAISAITRGELEIESLLFNRETTKDPELAPEIDELMKEICDKTENTVEADAAALVAKTLHMLRHVPTEVVEEVAEKVRGGRYCGNSARLESIFFDAVAFIHDSGAVKVMVEEIENGRATGGRLALYTAALYLTPRPTIEAVEALTALFESARPKPAVMLAAASVVNRYCHITPDCNQEAPVERIAEVLASKIGRHCTPSSEGEAEIEIVATLKALGNMGVVTPAVTTAAVNCIEKHDVPTTIRVAAAQAFRQAKCHRPAVEKLVDIVVRPEFETEVRITSYLSAVRCAEMEDLEKIFEMISEEENTQVRGFILGHLMNIQESTCPSKERLRYLLTNFVIPTDFERDFRKFSQNIQMGYHSPAFGVGAEVESNIVYAPGAFVPRAVTMNLMADFDEVHMDIAEIGARFEGIDAIIEQLLGPEGYLRKAEFGKILEDITGFAEEKGMKIMDHLKRSLRTKRSIDFNTISEFFDKIYGERNSKETRAEVFARVMGHEVTYANIAEIFRDITGDELIETIFNYFDASLEQMKNFNINTARTGHLFMDYTLPTIQGLPLKLNLAGTAVVGMKLEGNFNIPEILADLANMDTKVTLMPSLSVEATGFVGFDNCITKVGIEMQSTVSIANGATLNIKTVEGERIEVELDIPEKVELLNIKAETFLVKAVGKKVTKVTPSTIRDVRVKRESCIEALEPMLGIKMCYEVNIPNVFHSNGIPLGEPIVAKLFVEKADPSMKGYIMTAAMKTKGSNKAIQLTTEVAGASTPRRAEITFTYKNEGQTHTVSAKLDATSVAAGIWTTLTNEVEYKALESLVKFNSGAIDIARGIKVEFRAEGESQAAEYAMNVFVGRNKKFAPETEVFEAKFIKKASGTDINVDAICKTKNALVEYLNLDVKVDMDFTTFGPNDIITVRNMPKINMILPTIIRKMEVTAGIANWKLVSFIRGGHETPEACTHATMLKLTRGRREIISVEATHKIEGRLTENIIFKNEATVAIGSTSYKGLYDVFYHTNKIGFAFELMGAGSEKFAAMEAIYSRAGEEHNARFLVEVPEFMRPVKFEAKIGEEASDRYTVEAVITHGERTIMEVTGPVTARLTSKMMKFQTNMKIAGLTPEPYLFASNLVFATKKQVIAFAIKEREETVFNAEWKMVRDNADKTTIGVAVVLPTLIEYNLDAVITGELVHASFNNLVLPNTSSQRRVKGFVDVTIPEKKAKVEFTWDADRNPEKKMTVDATLMTYPARPGHAEIHGNIAFMGEPYHLKMEFVSTNLMTKLEGENGVKVTVTTPAQKTLGVEAHSVIELEGSAIKAITNFGYKTMEDQEYKVVNDIVLEKLGGAYGYAFESNTVVDTPEGDTKLKAVMKHQDASEECAVLVEFGVDTPILKTPFNVEFSIHNTETSSTGICKMERQTPRTIFEWGLEAAPEGGLKAVEAGFDMKAVVEVLKVVRALVSWENEVHSHYSASTQTGAYYYRFDQSAPTYSFMMRTPSRTMEGEAKWSPYESALKFYPNKDRSDAKYELGYKANHEEIWGEHKGKFEICANHPTMPKPALFALQYTASAETIRGTVELDIFPEHENKITGTLETRRISETGYRTEITLAGKMLRDTPKVIIDAAYAPETIVFGMIVHKNPSAAPAFAISAKYDETSATNAALALTVEKEGRTVFMISGATEPEEEATCNGVAMKGILFTADFGHYDIITKMCKPAFVEIISKRQGGEREHIAKIGLRYPNNAEIGLFVADGELEEPRAAAVAAVMLTSPTLVDIELANTPEGYEIMAEITGMVEELMMAIETTAMDAIRFLETEATANGIHFPSSQLVTLVAEAKEEIRAIYQEIVAEMVEFDIEVLRDIMESPTFSYISRVYLSVWTKISHLQNYFTTSLIENIKNIEEVVVLPETIKDLIMEIIRMVETGELPEIVSDFLEKIEETKLYRMVKREIDALIEEYPEEYEAIKFIVTEVFITVERDVKMFIEEIMKVPAVERIINWIIHYFDSEHVVADVAEKAVTTFIEEILFVAMKTSADRVKIQIPLHRPLYSLTQVAQEAAPIPTEILKNLIWAYVEYIPIPVENMIWAYYNFVPRYITEVTDLLPPFPRVAMVVGGTEILTFDGLVVRAPRSPCKVLLAAHGRTHRLIMSHPQATARPQFELKTPEATVVIKPDFEVVVNGRPLSSSEETVGKLRIENIGEHIEVACPVMKVIVAKSGEVVAVEASGWLFGRVAGLLGPNNGEVADNLMMPNGEVAPNPRELVAAWQEDKQCSTPEVPRAETNVARVVECEAFLGIRSRCNPVVRPHPFMEMCRVADDACDAAKAYRTICAFKGVEEIFPINC